MAILIKLGVLLLALAELVQLILLADHHELE